MNLSPSQNNLLKSLSIIPLQVTMQSLRPSLGLSKQQQTPHTIINTILPQSTTINNPTLLNQQAKASVETIVILDENLMRDLQLLLPELSKVVSGDAFGFKSNRLDILVVPLDFNFDAAGKRQLWQFLQQLVQA